MLVFVLTGAGLSAESGIRTFRDAPDALWAQYDPMALATPEAFAADPDLVHRFYGHRRAKVLDAAPNAAHRALARLQAGLRARGGEAVLCTQNVDDLLERGGAGAVMHMHGSLLEGRCLRCGTVSPWRGTMDVGSACPACGTVGGMRPNVVWFGEVPLFLDEIAAGVAAAEVFVAVGTSGTVYPAAGLVDLAREAGARTVEINLQRSERAGAFDDVRLGPATEAVPAWVAEMLGEG
jgi:NAD-dependent deacetylase